MRPSDRRPRLLSLWPTPSRIAQDEVNGLVTVLRNDVGNSVLEHKRLRCDRRVDVRDWWTCGRQTSGNAAEQVSGQVGAADVAPRDGTR